MSLTLKSKEYELLVQEVELLANAEKWKELRVWFTYWDNENELVYKVIIWSKFFLPNYFRDASPDFHLELIQRFFSNRNEYTAAPRGFSKALALNTSILTSNGFKNLGDINIGDKIFTEKGKQTTVIKKSEVFKNRDCYKVIFSDGTEIVADAEHDWSVETRNERGRVCDFRKRNKFITTRLVIKTTKELSRDVYVKSGKRLEVNYSIPTTEPLEFEEKDLLLDPYYIGQWLGDGTSNDVGITTADEETVEFIYGYAKELGLNVTVQKAGGISKTYSIVNQKRNSRQKDTLRGKLRILNLLNNKHIPDDYLFASKDQRLSLLRGLMDSDGSISKDNSCSFTGINKRLVQDVQKLLWTFGIKSTLAERDAKLYGVVTSKVYQLPFTTKLDIFLVAHKKERLLKAKANIRTQRRYIVDIVKVNTVPVQCLGVDNPTHLFLAGNELVPTHNTTILQACCGFSIANGLDKFIVLIEKSFTEASEVLFAIRDEFANNNLIKGVYGNLIKKDSQGLDSDKSKDTQGDVFINGVRLRAKGFDSPIRGLKAKEFRPTRIILDDVESDDHINSVDQRKKYQSNFLQGIIPALDIDCYVKVYGTILHNDSLLSSLIQQHKGKIFKAYDKLRPKETLLWESRWPYETLEKKREEMMLEGFGSSRFYQEFLNEAIDDERRRFRWEFFKEYKPSYLESKALNRYITVDTAQSKNDGADYTGVTVVDWDSDNNWYIVFAKRYKINLPELIDYIFKWWGFYKPAVIGVERKAFEDQIKPYLDIKAAELGIFPIVKELEDKGTRKEDRILGALEGRFEAGKVYFLKGATDDQVLLKGELYDFPVGKYNDLIDSLAYIEQLGSRPYSKDKQIPATITEELKDYRRQQGNLNDSRLGFLG